MVIPLGNKILLKQKVSEEQISPSGIFLKQDSKRFPIGKVIAIGEKVGTIKIGDDVFFEGWNGEPVSEELGGEKNLLLIGEEKIIARYRE